MYLRWDGRLWTVFIKLRLRICNTAKNHRLSYLLRARTVKPDKQPLLDNGCITCNNAVTPGSGVFCAVLAEAM
jgi:hypothetical protein